MLAAAASPSLSMLASYSGCLAVDRSRPHPRPSLRFAADRLQIKRWSRKFWKAHRPKQDGTAKDGITVSPSSETDHGDCLPTIV